MKIPAVMHMHEIEMDIGFVLNVRAFEEAGIGHEALN